MRLWKKVPIGGALYRIYIASPEELRKLNDGENVFAATFCNEAKIIVSRETPPDSFPGTVLHELAHAMLFESHLETSLKAKYKGWNDNEEEVFIKSIEATLVPALRALGWRIRKPRNL